MKVRELISALQSEQQESVVILDGPECEMGFCDISDINSISIKVNEEMYSGVDYDRWGKIPAVHLLRT